MVERFLVQTIVFVLGFALSAFPQKNKYALKGFMGIQGGESFTYKLDLQDSVGNIMSGYAYTYSNEKNDVKASVVAVIDRSAKTITLREMHILYNNYFVSKATICLVEALLTYNAAEKSLSGPLNTNTAGNGAACSRGSISFNNVAELDQLFSGKPALNSAVPDVAIATPTKPEIKKPAKLVYDTVAKAKPITAQPAVAKTENITEGKGKTYYWENNEIVLEIWDGNNVDNDRVTILMNGETVLSNHVLTKERKKITLPVGGNELNIISIVANNEGNDPPNTASIQLSDGDTHYDIIAHNTIGKMALINIKRKTKK